MHQTFPKATKTPDCMCPFCCALTMVGKGLRAAAPEAIQMLKHDPSTEGFTEEQAVEKAIQYLAPALGILMRECTKQAFNRAYEERVSAVTDKSKLN